MAPPSPGLPGLFHRKLGAGPCPPLVHTYSRRRRQWQRRSPPSSPQLQVSMSLAPLPPSQTLEFVAAGLESYQSADGTIVPPGKEFGPDYDGRRPLPPRTRNPRDILNDGERGFIVDLKMNIEVEIQLKAAIMGDLTLSVL
ncbi:hypothetical protein Cob_v000696 [Colletotrichum orbiculare MAFF 240422]|uniref:Uncharacterized protein n=1 Tax=Colletotrichum orbiculare (strain 104-T / ATCC 96160 / CBS 514.97 / LARS 414 / MAFF 240422) TaxID=1213857 RepID=A0A484G800_COLOR|nr:hypothetical protein Cob_v000696 [Colletotrichum orbiculare MAFF 240422]